MGTTNIRHWPLALSLSAVTGWVMASPIPETPDEWYQGQESYFTNNPRSACNAFNDKVALINAHIKKNYPDSGLIYNQLCKSIRVNEMQVEDSSQYVLPVAGWWGRGWNIVDRVDVARTIDMLVLSASNKTTYMMFINGDAVLKEQEIEDPSSPEFWETNQMAPFFYRRDGHFGNNWHGTNQKSFISGQIALDAARSDANEYFGNQIPPDHEYAAKVMEFLSDHCASNQNADCIPDGGSSNSGNLVLEKSYPEDTYSDKYINLTTEQSLSFDIGGSFEGSESDGMAAGMSMNFGYATSTAQSQEFALFYVSNYPYANDISSLKDYSINGVAVGGVSESGIIQLIDDSWNFRVANPDVAFGSQTWRIHDLSSVDIWYEDLSEENCLAEEEIVLGNTLNLARSTIDFDGSNWTIDQDDTRTVTYRYDYSGHINTHCTTDSKGQTFKVVADGLLYKR